MNRITGHLITCDRSRLMLHFHMRCYRLSTSDDFRRPNHTFCELKLDNFSLWILVAHVVGSIDLVFVKHNDVC